MYIIITVVLFAVFAYYATWFDEKLNINLIGLTVVMGAIACIAWPITLGIVLISLPFYFIMKLGAKRRGDI